MPAIYDNIEKHLEHGLINTLKNAVRADFCIGYFNLRGWMKLHDVVDSMPGAYLPENLEDDNRCFCRIIIGMHKTNDELVRQYLKQDNQQRLDNAEAVKLKNRLAEEFRTQLTIGIPTNAHENALQKLSAQLKQEKVRVKLFIDHPLHAKLYLAFRKDYNSPVIGFIGSSNLTLSGISKQGELNVDVVEQDAAGKLAQWFQDRWEHRWCIDITKELAEIIDTSWASETPVLPYHVYLKIVYHLSREARAGISEFNLTKEFKNVLLEYQANAVKVAAGYLNRRGGVIIGDVVGLGKTVTATALAKIFEQDFFFETLIICPKNLVSMWEDYVHKYGLRRTKVISITRVQSELGEQKRFRLVIIDESHNLRNRLGKRYRAVHEYIHKNDSKVILLTATPYNKTYTDLSSQLGLFLDEDENLGISPELFIGQAGGLAQFTADFQVDENTLAAFEKSGFSDDWNELMRLFLVRRTRSFIKNNYAKDDPDNGRKFLLFPDGSKSYFPERIPKKVEYDFDPDDEKDPYARLYSEEIISIIDSLHLPRYGLGQKQYRLSRKPAGLTKEEKQILENLGRAGARLKGFARTNLFKRLESSAYSFLLSVSRHILRNCLFIHALENKKPLPIGQQESGLIDEFMYSDKDDENSSFESLFVSESDYMAQAELYFNHLFENQHGKYRWLQTSVFTKQLKKSLVHDTRELVKILETGQGWNPSEDRKIKALAHLCMKKHKHEKILVFTQYSDTAGFVFRELENLNLSSIECVTGDSEDPTAAAHRFSPLSNEKQIPENQQIRVLITTDVLSEGQNLQDAHIVVNYDLPWAIIRLIQRAGRVDRIGQNAPEILCYSFVPEDGIENIIRLRERLRMRIKENAETVGSDETFFEGDPVNIRDLYNEKSGILDDEDETEIDLASYAYEIWKTASQADPKLKRIISKMPPVAYSAMSSLEKPGAVVYTKTAKDNDLLAWMDENKEIVTRSQFRILKAIRCAPDTSPLTRPDNHHELVKTGVNYIKNSEDRIGGQLGKKSGARYRVYTRMSDYAKTNPLFVNEALKKAIDDIYKYPLQEYARESINRQLKAGAADHNIGELITSLMENGRLVIAGDEQTTFTEPQIICSMGMVKTDE